MVYADMSEDQICSGNFQYGTDAEEVYSHRQSFLDSAWFDCIASKLTHMVGKGRMLDVGCGNGLLLRSFKKHGWYVEGVDVSPWAKHFSKQYGYRLHSMELEQCTIIQPDSFDVITSTSTLEHISKPVQHIAAMFKFLRKGGIAFFSGIPNYGSWAIRLHCSAFDNNTPPGHVNYFTVASLRRAFSFIDSISSMYIGTYGIPECHFVIQSIQNSLFRTSKDIGDKRRPPDSRSSINGILASMIVKSWSAPGRLFNLGDKLKAIARKG